MAEQKERITREDLQKLMDELDHRIQVVRMEIAQELNAARSRGDLAENAEYQQAKNRQIENENRIDSLQEELSRILSMLE